ncbi:hypothetical protein NP233_g5074 [Leucocoprinus birnbaumii]|uniref:Uncharacterized protein n=1 Tax=Leucocoprinus birnbaumii TaxID=56174 RepID=A0AAD5VVV2_9AGAR|nr:hypothetical protein NP233_g5074 [Leucocoprinus birnbaumii]
MHSHKPPILEKVSKHSAYPDSPATPAHAAAAAAADPPHQDLEPDLLCLDAAPALELEPDAEPDAPAFTATEALVPAPTTLGASPPKSSSLPPAPP